jgi:hypothetical protein
MGLFNKLSGLHERDTGKIPTTAVTNEIVRAIKGLNPVPSLGQFPKVGGVSPPAQLYQVAALPDMNMSSGMRPAYVVANPVAADGTVGSANVCIGCIRPFDIGDPIYGTPVNRDWKGRTYQQSGGGINIGTGSIVSPILFEQSPDAYGIAPIASVNYSSGSMGDGHSPSNASYNILSPSGAVPWALNISVQKRRLLPFTMQPAIKAQVFLDHNAEWEIWDTDEYTGATACNTSSGSPALSTISDAELTLLPDYNLNALPD